MEGLAYIYMALAYEEVQNESNCQEEIDDFPVAERQYVDFDRELSREDVNKNYSNFCTAKF
ncbi:MAG TPA: hypothetical protein V6D28_16425 [Leptolyngbyaceae cyanobacterium]